MDLNLSSSASEINSTIYGINNTIYRINNTIYRMLILRKAGMERGSLWKFNAFVA